ncbi:unknown [Clostridium sp. CAG:1219]|nr:unknown [Clostridium sp. CAG:1219]
MKKRVVEVKEKPIKRREKLSSNIKEDYEEQKKSGILTNYYNFYKKHLKLPQIIFFIIMVIIFGIAISTYISNLNAQDYLEQVKKIAEGTEKVNVFSKMFVEKLPLVLLIIVSGFTPFVFLPVLGVVTGYLLASDIILMVYSVNNTHNLILMCVGSMMQLLGYSLAISMGIYWCRLATKRFRYSQSQGYSTLDIKRHYYELKEDKKKLKELDKKREEKYKKYEKLNVKIPYVTIFISFVISLIFVLLGTIIFYI